MSDDTPETQYDYYTRQAQAHEAKFAAADIARINARDAKRAAEYEAQRAAFYASNPWPTDPTALNGSRMGLTELITARGD